MIETSNFLSRSLRMVTALILIAVIVMWAILAVAIIGGRHFDASFYIRLIFATGIALFAFSIARRPRRPRA
jgi:hypothetical protein